MRSASVSQPSLDLEGWSLRSWPCRQTEVSRLPDCQFRRRNINHRHKRRDKDRDRMKSSDIERQVERRSHKGGKNIYRQRKATENEKGTPSLLSLSPSLDSDMAPGDGFRQQETEQTRLPAHMHTLPPSQAPKHMQIFQQIASKTAKEAKSKTPMAFTPLLLPILWWRLCSVFIFCVSPLLCLSTSFSFPGKSGHQQGRSLPLQLLLESLDLEVTRTCPHSHPLGVLVQNCCLKTR